MACYLLKMLKIRVELNNKIDNVSLEVIPCQR